jgi:branched-chain amino acid transport system substrate-binding protein
LIEEAARKRLTITAEVPFSGDQEDLSTEAERLLADDPGVVVVLGDSDDGGRLLAALDAATVTGVPNRVIVNDALRSARQTIQGLSDEFRTVLEGVAPLAQSTVEGAPAAVFAGHAADCLNLIALAAEQAGSDSPRRISANMAAVSVGGRACAAFADCVVFIDNGLQIDYNGFSGAVDLSSTSGDPTRATFEAFSFGDDGVENAETTTRFDAP